MEANMRKNIAHAARLVRDVSLALYSVLRVVEKVIDIVNKAANYHDRKYQTQVLASR